MQVLMVAATRFELAKIEAQWPSGRYQDTLELTYLTTGVGPVFTAAALTEQVLRKRPDLIINVGLAGALDASLALGEVVHVVSEEFGDLGVEEQNGSFTSMIDLGLVAGDEAPFEAGLLPMPSEFTFAKQVSGTTVSAVHGSANSIAAFKSRTSAQVESMEGAAVFYVALRQNLPAIQLRGISNYVEPRDRDNWQIEPALLNLSETVHQLLSSLPGAVAARSARQQLGL